MCGPRGLRGLGAGGRGAQYLVPDPASLPRKLAWPRLLQLLAPIRGDLVQADAVVAGPVGKGEENAM